MTAFDSDQPHEFRIGDEGVFLAVGAGIGGTDEGLDQQVPERHRPVMAVLMEAYQTWGVDGDGGWPLRPMLVLMPWQLAASLTTGLRAFRDALPVAVRDQFDAMVSDHLPTAQAKAAEPRPRPRGE